MVIIGRASATVSPVSRNACGARQTPESTPCQGERGISSRVTTVCSSRKGATMPNQWLKFGSSPCQATCRPRRTPCSTSRRQPWCLSVKSGAGMCGSQMKEWNGIVTATFAATLSRTMSRVIIW